MIKLSELQKQAFKHTARKIGFHNFYHCDSWPVKITLKHWKAISVSSADKDMTYETEDVLYKERGRCDTLVPAFQKSQ